MLHRLAELDAAVRDGLCGFRLQEGRRAADAFHDQRSFGLLFRHPQGRALLRSAVEREAQGGAGDDRAYLPLRHDLARADPRLHRRGSLARRATRTRRRCICEAFPDVPSHWRDEALAKKWSDIRAIRAVVTGALEIERAQKRIGSSLEAAPVVHISDAKLARGARWRRFRRSLHHVGHRRRDRRRGAGRGVPLARGRRASRVVRAPRPASNARAHGDISIPPTADPEYPDVTPRDAQALREIAGLAGRGERVEP